METCSCGARIPAQARWCPVCLRPPVDRDALVEELHDAFRKTTWTPPQELARVPRTPRYSRWDATLFTFGPRTKVAVTILVGLLTVAVLWNLQPWNLFRHDQASHPANAFLFFETVLVIGAVTAFLRVLWKRARVE
jgi:hypothetical protein